jgi:hypothetical protein
MKNRPYNRGFFKYRSSRKSIRNGDNMKSEKVKLEEIRRALSVAEIHGRGRFYVADVVK